MKSFFISLLLFAGMISNSNGQNADSLKQVLEKTPQDTNRVKLLLDIAETYFFSKPDTCLLFAEKALNLARDLSFIDGQVFALNTAGEALRFLGDYPRALKMQFEALQINRKMKDLHGEARSLGFIGFVYVEFREYRQGLQYLLPAIKLNRQVNNRVMETFDLTNIGNAYDLLNMHDSALYYQQLALNTYTDLVHGPVKSLILTRYGNAFAGLGIKDSALIYFHKALQNARNFNDRVNIPKIHRKIAELYASAHQYDSSLYYARQAFINGQRSGQSLEILEASNLLVKLFRQSKNPDSAFYYQDIAKTMADRLYGPQKFKELQLLMLDEQERQQKIIQNQEKFKNRTKYIALLFLLGVFLLLAFLLFRNNRHKQKANTLLNEQKNKIEKTLVELKATQSQLIQSEKMASLGELTAGIAHEIQNPLNFVNNFSEVSTELVDEMNDEINKGNLEDAAAIANDLKQNLEKINHHGKRAGEIVKGMLQHSRSSSGVKEPTDINKLADEYLRLAYHGLRAKDKSFNATMKTDFDESIGNINIIPQDIGRVILNLINNAFYVVNEKALSAVATPTAAKYEPTVTVATKRLSLPSGSQAERREGTKFEQGGFGGILISIRDNGPGIPQKILDKIFQPFFTTKPTGQGTGLGLSLSYDIVKAHGGELKVETKEGVGSDFIIQLPINK